MAVRVELDGLAKARENFKKLAVDVQKTIGRDALRYYGQLLAKPMRAATYTTFNRRTGAIRAWDIGSSSKGVRATRVTACTVAARRCSATPRRR